MEKCPHCGNNPNEIPAQLRERLLKKNEEYKQDEIRKRSAVKQELEFCLDQNATGFEKFIFKLSPFAIGIYTIGLIIGFSSIVYFTRDKVLHQITYLNTMCKVLPFFFIAFFGFYLSEKDRRIKKKYAKTICEKNHEYERYLPY